MKSRKYTLLIIGGLLAASVGVQAKSKKTEVPPLSPLDRSIAALSQAQEAERQTVQAAGSLWSPSSRYLELAADLRSRRVGDVVTVLVAEKASAVSSGTVKTARNSAVQSGLSAAGGLTRAVGPIANLVKGGTTSSIDGQGTTSRDTALTTTISMLVTQVLPNGNLVIEGSKNVAVNSENQLIQVRGMIRPIDLDTTNSISSDRIAQMDIRVNGKGIVADSVRRPFILYRLIMSILPF